MAFFLLIPFFLIRFGLLAVLNQNALPRAAHFPPLQGQERAAYWIYQLSNTAVILLPLLLHVRTQPSSLFFTGAALYAAGLFLLTVSVANFAAPSGSGVNQSGLYRLSRNPMYVSYFLVFLGCSLLTQSRLLLGLILVFQISAHWIILAEERWCAGQFGEAYLQYKRQVRRYL
ncbi:isoprenylcysteine carboxylmethyltransferase family protein [uncultured Oscillibacter sp.]|uniref:methyltransferase family protein n=1 Tax=uncultured Oscillibacter sp. TaxID=876091 RepID=UPI0025E9664C|nr:isoprenylcysteine carboxylmethyltransferase family protein [uncultured Oscillibacter sp.]